MSDPLMSREEIQEQMAQKAAQIAALHAERNKTVGEAFTVSLYGPKPPDQNTTQTEGAQQ
jgi:hypothetical protein